jgi:putative addiction module killer protein
MNLKYELRRYQDSSKRIPYSEWFRGLDDRTAGRIDAYVDRMKSGNFGNSRSVGHGVAELKIEVGPGYRVYYLRDGVKIVILLCGGDKGSQAADILRALVYAGDYWERR